MMSKKKRRRNEGEWSTGQISEVTQDIQGHKEKRDDDQGEKTRNARGGDEQSSSSIRRLKKGRGGRPQWRRGSDH